MISISLLLWALLVFMIIASLIAIEARDLLSCVICVGTAGFGLALYGTILTEYSADGLQTPTLYVEAIIKLRYQRQRQSPNQPHYSCWG